VRRALIGVVLVALLTAGVALAGSVNGTWVGKLPFVQGPEVSAQERIPTSAFPSAKLVVATGSVVAEFSGLTQAAHDAANARATCTMRFRFADVKDGWRLYPQGGRPRIVGTSTGGMPEFSPCQTPSGGMLRLRAAGAKLKVEFTTLYQADQPFAVTFRGYLRR
jgi:hypothetical protein